MRPGSNVEVFPEEVEYVVALPDSLLAPLLASVEAAGTPRYIQVVHESQAIGLAAGLSLAGKTSLVCMENSGLRAACESIARLVVLHQVPLAMLVSHRGEFGDPNWWAQHHSKHMYDLLAAFGFSYTVAMSLDDLVRAIRLALAVVNTRMTSAVVIASTPMLRQLQS